MATASGSQSNSPSSPPKNSVLSNNPYQLLADHKPASGVEDEQIDPSHCQAKDAKVDSSGVQDMEKIDGKSLAEGEIEDESVSSAGISSAEKPLMSRTAQQVLSQICIARKLLMDNLARDEIESVYGPGYMSSLEQGMDGVKSPTRPQKDAKTINDDGAKSPSRQPNDVEMITNDEMITGEDLSVFAGDTAPQQDTSNVAGSQPQGAGSMVDTSTRSTATSTTTPGSVSQQSGAAGSTNQGQANKPLPTPNVSFTEATAKPNSNNLRAGNSQAPSKMPPQNPYPKKADSGILFAQRSPAAPARVEKIIALKKNNSRAHIHCYTLRFKTIKAKSDDEGHQIAQETLQQFLEIVLQADPKTIIPPYLELDRSDKSVSDLSTVFPVSAVGSFHVMKKYFFRLSNRDDNGFNWCRIFLAQSMPFLTFMEKAKYSLENNDFSLWPKASDNENTTDVGWLLYSTRAQDED